MLREMQALLRPGVRLLAAPSLCHGGQGIEAKTLAINRVREIGSVIASTANQQTATFRRSRVAFTTTKPKRYSRRGFLLANNEIATLFHPATDGVAAAGMARSETRSPEPPVVLPANATLSVVLGRTEFRDRGDLVGIKEVDRRRHVYAIGRTGMGKSALMQNMIQSDIHASRGVALLDPHGDLAEAVIGSLPRKRWNDLVIVDPADTAFPVAFNPLDCDGLDATQRALVASGVLEVFKKLFKDSFHAAARMEDIFRNAFLALVEVPGTSLLSLPQLFADEDFRYQIASRVSNPVVRAFWLEAFPRWTNRYRNEALAPVENKVRHFMSNPILQPILGQPKSKVKLRSIMDDGKILVVNLSKGNCGEDASHLLGSLFVTTIQQAAMSRADIPEHKRRDFYLYADEFQNFVTPAFATILSEARKYRLNLTLMHQFLGQLDDARTVRDAIFGNVGTLLSFSVGNEDAETIAKQFGDLVTPSDLVHLPKYHSYIGLMIDGKTSDPFLLSTLPPSQSQLSDENVHHLRTVSRQRYSGSKSEFDKQAVPNKCVHGILSP